MQDTTNSATTTTTTAINELSVSIESFNCHGYKESFDYVLERLQNSDFMCLSETWITPSELTLIQDNINFHVISKTNQFIVFNKSGMQNDDEHSTGRPYSGVAIICRVIDDLTYEMIQCENSRIVAVLIKDKNDHPIHLIVNVYMPYHDGTNNQCDEYLTCIDAVQAILDEFW